MNPSPNDPLALASATPNVAALIEEFTYALENGPARVDTLSAAEDTLFNRWAGKSADRDGRRHQANLSQGEVVRPYEGAPDTECNLPEELVGLHVDLDCFARRMARVGASTTHLTKLSAAKIAELTAVTRWCRNSTKKDRRNGGELLSRMKYTIGWAVLHTGWREKWGLVERTVTMDEVFQAANMAFQQFQQIQAVQSPESRVQSQDSRTNGGSDSGLGTQDSGLPPLVQLPGQIADETLEDQAVATIQSFLPHLKKSKVRRVVRDLRTTGEAEFMDRQLEYKGPYIETLIPGVNVFVSGGTQEPQKARGWLRVEFMYEAQVRAMAVDAEWNEEFIEAVIGTAGQTSNQGRGLVTDTAIHDAHEHRIEIWHTEVLQYDEDLGTTGIYCTTFSPHLTPGRSAADGGPSALRSHYARHYLLDSAHGQYPYVVDRHEVIGPAMDDARGIPYQTKADANQIRLHQNSLGVRAQWEVDPPMAQLGSGWSKVKANIAPGARIDCLMPGADVKVLALDKGNPAVGAAFIDRIERNSRRQFALPNNGQEGDHPSLWMMRAARLTERTLGAEEEAYLQLAILCYQELSPEELKEIIGRPPLLTVKDLLRCQVELTFDPRSLDNDWRKDTLETFIKLLSIDSGGLMDRGPLIQVIGSMTDTTLMDQVMRTPQGAQAQLYRKVEQDITSIMLGNPPPMVEMDPTAGMQLQMTMHVLKQNPKYMQALQQDEQVQTNVKTYVKNLQHSQQETELSPQQGRLGVQAMPQRPTTKGSALETAGNY